MVVPAENTSSPYATPASDVQPVSDDVLWNDLVAFAHDESYARKWRALHAGQSRFAGFNFPAFLFGLLWFVYRRMYGYGVAVVIALWVITGILLAMGVRGLSLNGFTLAFAIGVGVVANPIFYGHARRQLLGSTLPAQPEARVAAARALGKTNDTAVWVLVSISVVSGIIGVLVVALRISA